MNETTVLHGGAIAKHVKHARPHAVAVAYLGRDWRTYIDDTDSLEAVIVAPVPGTNPWAVQELVKALSRNGADGWERVYFLDNLHAKLYLGKKAAVWGSANLSRNGLGAEGLVELCVESRDPSQLQELRQFFDAILARANKAYPTVAAKKKAIAALEAQVLRTPLLWKEAGPEGVADLRNFDPETCAPFHVWWHQRDGEGGDETDEKVVLGDYRERFNDYVRFGPGAQVRVGQWILLWCWDPKKLSQDETVEPRWVFVDEVIRNASSASDPYKDAVFQRTEPCGEGLDRMQPFQLTGEVVDALYAALGHDDMRKAFIQPDVSGSPATAFDYVRAQEAVVALVKRMQAALPSRGRTVSDGQRGRLSGSRRSPASS